MSRKNQNHGRLESLHFRGCSITGYGIQTVQVSTVSVRINTCIFSTIKIMLTFTLTLLLEVGSKGSDLKVLFALDVSIA